MKKKPRIRKTKRIIKQPKTRYAVNRKPMAESRKFAQWCIENGIIVPPKGDIFNNMLLTLMMKVWHAALPRVRK